MNNYIKTLCIFTLASFWSCQNANKPPTNSDAGLGKTETFLEPTTTVDIDETIQKHFFSTSDDVRTQELDENIDVWDEHKVRCSELFLTNEDIQKILKKSEKISDYDWYNRGSTDCGVDTELNINGESFLFSYSIAGHGQLIPNSMINDQYDINDPRIVKLWYRKCDVHQEFFEWYIEAINWSPGSTDSFDNTEETLRFLCQK